MRCAHASFIVLPPPATIGVAVTLKASRIGYRNADGTVSDVKLHEEIMAGIDDTHLRLISAQRGLKLGLTREEVEKVLNVKLPPDSESDWRR